MALPHSLFQTVSRNCLVNSWTGLNRVFSVAQSGNKGASSPVLPAPGTPKWSPFGFTKQFLPDFR